MKRKISKKADEFMFSNRLLVGFQDIFGRSYHRPRLDLIINISKLDLVTEIAGLNYRLKGRNELNIDTSFESQQRELEYFCGKSLFLGKKYSALIDEFAKGRLVYIFSRQTCLFALEEIIQSDLEVIEDFKMSDSISSWEALLLYILCVNDEVTKIEESDPDEPINFETLNPKLLPILELMIVNDPFNIVYRGWALLRYFANNEMISHHIHDYFIQKYNVEYERFIFELLSLWMVNKHDKEDFNFYYRISEKNDSKFILDKLSAKFISKDTKKLLNIRKNPFFKLNDNVYVLTDLANLLDKAYYQLINDFYFDKLRFEEKTAGKKFNMQDYKSIIGSFFENYVRKKIQLSLGSSQLFKCGQLTIKMFDELIIPNTIHGAIEAGDVYIRNTNKIVFGEVKSSSLYDNEKFGGNVDSMYRNNRSQFFKNFGVDQLVNNIKNINTHLKYIDPDIPNFKKLRIWPVIIFNEKTFQTPFMAHIFNQRFQEQIEDINNENLYIYPLALIHISDLERMEEALLKTPQLFWELLNENFMNPFKYIPPFYHTLNKFNIKCTYKHFSHEVKPLFKKFGIKDINH